MKTSLFLMSIVVAFTLATPITSCTSTSSDEVEELQEREVHESRQEEQLLEALNNTLQSASDALYKINYGVYRTRGTMPTEENLSEEQKQQVRTSLHSIATATKQVLAHYGVTDQELVEIFGDSNDERIALAGIAFADFHVSRATRSLEWDDYADCAMRALGFNIFSSMRGAITKKLAIQMLKQVAKKVVGPVGVGITVAEFGWCLYRNS